MKVSELLEQNSQATPVEYKAEWDTAMQKKIREIAAQNGLTAKITGGMLQSGGAFIGKGVAITLTGRGEKKRDSWRPLSGAHAEENPEKYRKFWKEFFDEFHNRYELTLPITTGVNHRFTPNTPFSEGSGNFCKLYVYRKGYGSLEPETDPKYQKKLHAKVEKQLYAMINKYLTTSVEHTEDYKNNHGIEVQKALANQMRSIRALLAGERDHGRYYPEIEDQLDPDVLSEKLKKYRSKYHDERLTQALAGHRANWADSHLYFDPNQIERAISQIENARENGHPLPELEKILPKHKYKETITNAWERKLADDLIKSISHQAHPEHTIKWVTDHIKRLEAKGYKLDAVNDLLNKDKFPKKYFQVITGKDHPSKDDVIKAILLAYKHHISGNQNDLKVRTMIDFAHRAGFDSPELEMIEKSANAAKHENGR